MNRLYIILLLSTIWFASCSKQSSSTSSPSGFAIPVLPTPHITCYTGKILTQTEVGIALEKASVSLPTFQSETYAEVNSVWLSSFMNDFKNELFNKGIISNTETGSGWTKTFDCIYFVQAFRVLAEEQYNKDSFHSFLTANSMAIIWICYTRDVDVVYAKSQGWDGIKNSPKAPEGHAIVVILTDKGVIFFDPQTGPLQLSKTELESIYFSVA